MANWNPWHGCKKFSQGCLNCYVYRIVAKFDRDPRIFALTASFLLPLEKFLAGRNKGAYKLRPDGGIVYTCFSSDFFLKDADQYRLQAWQAIRERQDLHFFIPTKRIHRFLECIPLIGATGMKMSPLPAQHASSMNLARQCL